jgi:acyl-CoA reductase-like NAD-dependent aldehyde dehydrogenase
MSIEKLSSPKVKSILKSHHSFFKSGKTKSYEFRLKNLILLKKLIESNEKRIIEAVYKDLGKCEFEAYFSEIGTVLAEIDLAINKLKKWMKPQAVSSPLFAFYSRSYLYKEPYGTVLIISPWNYPFQLLIFPLVGAIAAGNTVVLKPSEIATHTSSLCAELISKHFDPKYISIMEGGAEIATEILKEKFDYIFFTGGTKVGRIIYQAAAKHLTPVTLELGGKSPCIVHHDIDLDVTAKRIVWGKFVNAGQTCIAPDYIYVHSSVKNKLIEKLKHQIIAFYGTDPEKSTDYARIVSDKHFDRIEKMMNPEQVVFGGVLNKATKYISPTLLDNIEDSDLIMQEEIFGPLLPILVYKEIEDVITYINDHPKPLALYVFSKSNNIQQQIIQNTSAGGVTINDTLMHIGNSNLPFGGIGDSGIGAYHGKFSFELFSHTKAVLNHSIFPDLKLRYSPYNFPLKWLKKFMKWFS